MELVFAMFSISNVFLISDSQLGDCRAVVKILKEDVHSEGVLRSSPSDRLQHRLVSVCHNKIN